MEKQLFDDLLASVREAGAIKRGEAAPKRVTRFEEPDARAIRAQLKLTRSQFAALIGVSERTIEGWEQGRRRPKGPALTLLRVASKYPQSVLDTTRR